MKPIPLFNLKAQYQSLRAEMRRAALKAIDSGAYILGPEIRAFEEEFARLTGSPFCVGVSSGTSALELPLKAMGIGPGDEVVVPAFTFVATASAVCAAGATPRFADIDAGTLTVGAAEIEAALTKRTRAVIPVHLYGRSSEMGPIMTLARKKRLAVVEDCAQAHLATWRGRQVGTFGDAGAFSFYPSKNLGAVGDAGAITTQSRRMAELLKELRHAGQREKRRYLYLRVGTNARLDEIQAAVLRVKLKRLADWTARRREIARQYVSELKGLPIILPDLGSGSTQHACHLFVIRLKERDQLAEHLKADGIGTGVYYPIPLSLQPAFAALKYRRGQFPRAEEAAKTVLAIPIYAEMTSADVSRVCSRIRSFFK